MPFGTAIVFYDKLKARELMAIAVGSRQKFDHAHKCDHLLCLAADPHAQLRFDGLSAIRSGVQNLTDTPTSHIYTRSRMGCEVCWRVTSLSGDVVCTIDDDEADVEVRAAFSDGTVVRTRRASNIETGRIVAALWLDAIQGEFAIR